MCRPVCPKWEYIVSLLSRILNASDGEEKVFWLVERILWCARCTSETRTRVPLHSTPLLLHSSTSSSTCTSCSPPTGRRSPPRSRENSEKNSDLLPFVIWTLVCLSPSDRSSVTLRDISREPWVLPWNITRERSHRCWRWDLREKSDLTRSPAAIFNPEPCRRWHLRCHLSWTFTQGRTVPSEKVVTIAIKMTSEVMQMPHVTQVNIRESQDAIIESVYRISSEILHHKWLHKQK